MASKLNSFTSIRIHKKEISDHMWSSTACLGAANKWCNWWSMSPPLLFHPGLPLIRLDCLLVSVLSFGYDGYPLPCWTILITIPHTYADVVKSRIQLRSTPPTGTPVQYIAHEFKAILAESGLYALSLLIFATRIELLANRRGLFRGLSPCREYFSSPAVYAT